MGVCGCVNPRPDCLCGSGNGKLFFEPVPIRHEWVLEEIKRLRIALQLIAQHPVEHSQKWEVGAKEMQNLARKALGEKE